MQSGGWPRHAVAALLALAGVLQVGEAVRADDVPFNSKFEVNAGGKAFEGTDGYLTLGGLAGLPLDRDYEKGMAFIDLEGHQLLEGDRAYNASLGYRWADWSSGTVWGVNAGLSGRSNDGDWYRWCTLGVERLAPDFDLRANGYLLCGEGQQDVRCEAVGFEGNSLLVANRADLGLQGFDLSIGADDSSLLGQPLFEGSDLYGKLEFYYFFGAFDGNAIGGRAQLDWQVADNIALNGWVSYDTLFETSGLVGVTVSFGAPARRQERHDELGTGERLISFIERRTLVPIHEDAFDAGSTGPLKDASGDAIPFWHVDNTAPAGGDGSYEHPFDSLAEAGAEAAITQPGDVIIFHVGDGTTNQQQDGITLQDGQYLIGGSFDRSFRLGGKDILLGELFQEQGRPVMTDSDGDALRLANDNYAAGFDIRDAAQQGVSGHNIGGLTMIDVGIYDSLGSGVELIDSSGSFLFSSIRLVGNRGDFAIDDAGGGMNLLNIAGSITIEDSLCSGNGVTGGAQRAYDCVEIVGGGQLGDLDVLISNTQFLDNWGNGLETHKHGANDMTVTLRDSQFSGNTESAVALQIDPDSTGEIAWLVVGNDIQGNGWGGLQLGKARGQSHLHLLVEDNVITGNATLFSIDPSEQSAVALTVLGGTSDVVVRNNVLSDHAALGFYFVSSSQTDDGALSRLLIEDNVITGNGGGRTDDFRGGLLLVGLSRNGHPDESQIEATIRGNLIDGNALRGAEVFVTNGIVSPATTFGAANVCVNLQDNSGGDALFVNAGTNQFQQTSGGLRERTAGGDLFLDPASGGNATAPTTSGFVGSRACQAVQGF